jgi:hypothetical protein
MMEQLQELVGQTVLGILVLVYTNLLVQIHGQKFLILRLLML